MDTADQIAQLAEQDLFLNAMVEATSDPNDVSAVISARIRLMVIAVIEVDRFLTIDIPLAVEPEYRGAFETRRDLLREGLAHALREPGVEPSGKDTHDHWSDSMNYPRDSV